MYFHMCCVFMCHRTLCLGQSNFLYLLAVSIAVSKAKVVPPSGHYAVEIFHKCQCTLLVYPNDVNWLSYPESQSRMDRTCLLACFREYLVITWSGTLTILRFPLGFHKPSRQIMAMYLNILGHAVAQLVEALRYKSEGRGFDSQWCNWNFTLT